MGATEQEQLNALWSRYGLTPEQFPVYYQLGPSPFLDAANAPSGAAGSRLRLSRSISNFPHLLIGVRVQNVYALPAAPTADDVQLYRTMKEWVDGEQTIRMELAQQSIIIDPTLQPTVTGQDGVHWHPFAVPFPMAGSNNINFDLVRVTGYPQLDGEDVIPDVYLTLVAVVLKADLKTIAPHRMDSNNPMRYPG